ncbi:hypothetical protein Ssi02_39610 [Sinosporangium siamense]|uniref:Uncharacterized protein n=1 Tax=Sinosporangium siamense TaxID=1367973 RepID=A0A919RH11_9ACTN|nr:hypothetical protein Ssi02_39610 [Sinosporangium siamense]
MHTVIIRDVLVAAGSRTAHARSATVAAPPSRAGPRRSQGSGYGSCVIALPPPRRTGSETAWI